MSGTSLILTYNNIFAENYQRFIRFAREDRDLVHRTYLKIFKNFSTANFTGVTDSEIRNKIYAYCKSSIYNTFLTQQRLRKYTINPDEVMDKLEIILQNSQNENDSEKENQKKLEYINKKLFEYLKKNYNESDQYVYTCYFLYDKDKRLTYKQLSVITGYSISKVCGIIKMIKTDLKQNLIKYINDN